MSYQYRYIGLLLSCSLLGFGCGEASDDGEPEADSGETMGSMNNADVGVDSSVDSSATTGSTSHVVVLEDFDTSCTLDMDCVAVPTGDVCTCETLCPSAAVNKEDADRVLQFMQEATCASRTQCGSLTVREQPLTCAEGIASCVDGQCQYNAL